MLAAVCLIWVCTALTSAYWQHNIQWGASAQQRPTCYYKSQQLIEVLRYHFSWWQQCLTLKLYTVRPHLVLLLDSLCLKRLQRQRLNKKQTSWGKRGEIAQSVQIASEKCLTHTASSYERWMAILVSSVRTLSLVSMKECKTQSRSQ